MALQFTETATGFSQVCQAHETQLVHKTLDDTVLNANGCYISVLVNVI